MPSRLAAIAIVLCWIGTSVWLFQREIWPRLEPGVVPPFSLYETDDSQPSPIPVRWLAWHTKPRTGPYEFSITTSVIHNDKNKEDEFILNARLGLPPESTSRLKRLETAYRVHRQQMLGLTAGATFEAEGLGEVIGDYIGEVEDRVCSLRWQKKTRRESDGDQIGLDVSRTGTVMMPLHPLHRMEGLKPGRRWGLYLFDPLDLPSASVPSAPPRHVWVNAEVRERAETLDWHSLERNCWVIDYTGEAGNVSGSTWVDQEDGRVLKMTTRLGAHEESWDIVRER